MCNDVVKTPSHYYVYFFSKHFSTFFQTLTTHHIYIYIYIKRRMFLLDRGMEPP